MGRWLNIKNMKIAPENKQKILNEWDTKSAEEWASEFGVSKRYIYYLRKPRSWKTYYNKERHKEHVRRWRAKRAVDNSPRR
jgi:hypothetical protein